MLAKRNRLNRKEFSKHFKKGKRIHSPAATLIVSPNNIFNGAVVVSKKVSKKAVERNMLRRRAYAQLYNAFKNKKTGVYILLLKPAIKNHSRKEQQEVIGELIARMQ